MAPEQHQAYKTYERYDGFQSDVFSLGIILFIMVMGSPPFMRAERSDRHYLPIAAGKFEFFWKNSLSQKPDPNNFISKDLKDLITGML